MTRSDLNEQLLEAARSGDSAACVDLLDRGADIEAKDDFQKTALGWAAYCGYTNICLALLASGADSSLAIFKGDQIRLSGLSRLQCAAELGDSGLLIKALEADDQPGLMRRANDAAGIADGTGHSQAAHSVRSWLAGREAQVVLTGLVEAKPKMLAP